MRSQTLTFLLTLLGCLVLTGQPVLAASEYQVYTYEGTTGGWNSPSGGTTIIKAYVPPEYQISIPAEMNIPYGQAITDIGAIVLKKANLEPGAGVYVQVSDNRQLIQEQNKNKNINFQLQDKDKGTLFTEVIFMEPQKPGASASMQVKVKGEEWEKAQSGSYSATLSFAISYRKN